MAVKRKQITFDVDTNICKQIFGEKKFRQPYNEIRKFLEDNNWTHIEGSSYMSKDKMDNMDVSNLINDLIEQYPYLNKCVKKMHQADISNIHSLEGYFEYDGSPGIYKDYYKMDEAIDQIIDQVNDNEIELDIEM